MNALGGELVVGRLENSDLELFQGFDFKSKQKTEIIANSYNSGIIVQYYPNPVLSTLLFENLSSQFQLTNITITSLDGRTMKTIIINNGDTSHIKIDLSDLDSGIYLVHLNNGLHSVKIIKSNI